MLSYKMVLFSNLATRGMTSTLIFGSVCVMFFFNASYLPRGCHRKKTIYRSKLKFCIDFSCAFDQLLKHLISLLLQESIDWSQASEKKVKPKSLVNQIFLSDQSCSKDTGIEDREGKPHLLYRLFQKPRQKESAFGFASTVGLWIVYHCFS